MADEVLKLLDAESTIIPALEAQLKEVRKSIANIMKAIEQGVLTKTTKARLEELEAEEERIVTSILTEQNKRPQLTKEQILFTLDRFRSLDLSVEKNRERLIDSFVKCIILNDDHIIITTVFKNEPVTVMTKDEVKTASSLGSDINSLSPP